MWKRVYRVTSQNWHSFCWTGVSLHYLVKCQCLKATIENKTTSVTTHFKKVTTGNNVFIVSMFSVAVLLPDILARCQRYSWTLQQDGAPSQTARNTLTYLWRENVTFIEPDMWPPKQPGLESSRLRCLGYPSADGLSTSTIHDNQPAKAGDRHWVGQTVAAFHCHWSVALPAWLRLPAARRTHWTFDVKTAWCDSYFRQ